MNIYRIYEDTGLEYIEDVILISPKVYSENEFEELVGEAREKGFSSVNEISVYLLQEYNFKEVKEISFNVYQK